MPSQQQALHGLDNIPASAIEKIEIINNPSARYDANGMAGIINIVLKKEKKEGLNGKVGFIAGIGALGAVASKCLSLGNRQTWPGSNLFYPIRRERST